MYTYKPFNFLLVLNHVVSRQFFIEIQHIFRSDMIIEPIIPIKTLVLLISIVIYITFNCFYFILVVAFYQ